MIAKRLPAVTLILIAANLLAAFWLVLTPELIDSFGFRPDQPRIQTAFTSLFLHANIFHMLGNMVFLAAVGAAVELATGSLRFALVYFVSGLAGVGFHFLMTRHAIAPAPYIGASGCIAGCAAYYSVRYIGLKVPILPHRGISVAAVTGVWVALQVIGAFVHIGSNGGTSFWAHLGGFVAGIVLSVVFRAPDLGQARLGHEVLERMNVRGPGAVVLAAKQHLETHPSDTKVMGDLASAYGTLGEVELEAETLVALLEISLPADQPEVLTRISEINQCGRLPVLRRLQEADRLGSSYPNLAKALLQSVVQGPEDVRRPEAMFSLADLEMPGNPEAAKELLTEMVRQYPLHDAVALARKRGWVS